MKPPTWVVFALAAMCFLLPAVAIAGAVALVANVTGGKIAEQPQVELPLELIASVLALIGAIAFLVIVFNQLNLTTATEALGLPDGSIRAVIAISLLFLFLIMSVFLYGSVGTAPQPAVDIAKQLVTTVATLAVSVAGFYFGAQSVQSATAAVTGVQTLSVVSPGLAVSRAKGDLKPIDFELTTTPPGLAINGQVSGDGAATLAITSTGSYRYTPSANAGEIVGLIFTLAGNPQVSQTVVVKAG